MMLSMYGGYDVERRGKASSLIANIKGEIIAKFAMGRYVLGRARVNNLSMSQVKIITIIQFCERFVCKMTLWYELE